jgi:mRNA interferase MazF
MVAPNPYVPRRGDLVWISFNPKAGHEQAGRRPAVVLSPEQYNRRVGLALFCPVTSLIKGYPSEVLIPEHPDAVGVVLASGDTRASQATARRGPFS